MIKKPRMIHTLQASVFSMSLFTISAIAAAPPWITEAHNKPMCALPGAGVSLGSGHYFPARSSPPRATLVCLHGIQTHSAWFSLMAPQLNERGIAVVCPDRRGSGRRKPGTKAVADVERRSQWIEDVDATVTVAQRLDAPVYLLGTSWGAKLALGYAAEKEPAVAGVILLVPALKTTRENPLSDALAWVGGMICPRLSVSPRLKPDDYVPRGESDPGFVADFGNDPWLIDRATFRFLREARVMQKDALSKLRNNSDNPLPMRVLFAKKDRIVKEPESRALLPAKAEIDSLKDEGHGVQVLDPGAAAKPIADWIEKRLAARR